MDAIQYAAEKLNEAKARLAATHRKCEKTEHLTTPEGVLAYARARACHESDRKQVAYWTSEVAKVGKLTRVA
jgi:hypothetical protein